MFAKQTLNALRLYKPYSTLSIFATKKICQRIRKLTSLVNQKGALLCTTVRPEYYATENSFIFDVIREIPALHTTAIEECEHISDEATFTAFLSKDWRNSSATDIVKAFGVVKRYCIQNGITFSDPRFDGLVDGLVDHCENLTDEQILELLKYMTEYPGCSAYTSHNFHDMWSCLDDLCCCKMVGWDTEKKFAFADIWFKLRLSKISDFTFKMLDRLLKKADDLTKDELVRVFFYINACRRRSVDFEFESALAHKVGEMNVDEMAVVALGYFKSKSKIKLLPIVEAIVKKVTDNALGIHDISVTAIMKVLRYSHPIRIIPQINKMLDSLHPELGRLTNIACLHIALLATGIQNFQPKILRSCSQILVEDISNMRLKDIERILHVLTMFSFDPKTKPDIFEETLNELHKDSRLKEINRYPRSLISALNFFSLRGIYSYDLMDRILDYEFITIHLSKIPKNLPRDLFSLDCCIDVDCLDYKGNRLPLALKYKAAKWLTDWPPTVTQWKKTSQKDQLFLDALNSVESMVGNKQLVNVQHVLPHFPTADIIVCKDLNTDTFVTPRGLERYVLGDVMKPFNDGNLKWYAFVMIIWNNVIRDFQRDGNNVPLGHTAMKLRQLEKIGYTPIVVMWNQFSDLSPEQKEQYLLDKLLVSSGS